MFNSIIYFIRRRPVLFALLLLAGIGLLYNSYSYEQDKSSYLNAIHYDDIKNQVANDAVREYEIAARQGDKMQMYVQACMCSASFLQAQDEPNYKKWKHMEDSLGSRIGLPRQYR